MGIDMPAVQLLCCAKNLGVDFSDTMMIGRQNIHISAAKLAPVLSAIGIDQDHALSALSDAEFAEPLFRLMGAKTIRSLDTSGYEDATDIHDLNEPLPPHLSKMFSVVHDGGTLEHVFNIVEAFKSAAEMVKIGGHFIQINIANNFMGHGFWQFSPELIYRALSAENGFSIRAMFLHEVIERGAWYQVEDPAKCGSRVELCNHRRTYICTIAKRISEADIFSNPAQQSDYVEAWRQTQKVTAKKSFSSIRRLIPNDLKIAVRERLNNMIYSPFDRPYYRKIAVNDLLLGNIAGSNI